MIKRLIRWWRARRDYARLCEAMTYTKERDAAMRRWGAKR